MSRRPPSILFITPTWPGDRAFGGQLRALQVGRALRHIGRVSLLVVGSNAENVEARERTAAEFEVLDPVPEKIAWNRGATQRLRRAFDPRYLNIHGVETSATDRVRVAAYVHDHDLVWIMNGRTPNIVQIWRWPHTHLDIDDVPSSTLSSALGRGMIQRMKTDTRRMLLRRREHSYRQRFTTLSVCSEADRRYLGGEGVHVIPNGFERPLSPPLRQLSVEAPRLGFIGLFSHGPNLEGMRWFLRTAWPQIRAAVPGIRLRLVGKDTDSELRPADAAVDALGWVPDPAAEIATWSAMVIPILSGGGTRIKVAEAFSRKCPVVATPLGAYGYEVTDRVQLRIAADPSAFAAACIELVRNPREAASLAERAWNDFLDHWTWEAITPRIWAAAEDCLRDAMPVVRGWPRWMRAIRKGSLLS